MEWGPVIVAFVASLPSTITALGTLVAVIRTARKVEEVHLATNSLQDKLVAATKVAAHAEGMAAQRASEVPPR